MRIPAPSLYCLFIGIVLSTLMAASGEGLGPAAAFLTFAATWAALIALLAGKPRSPAVLEPPADLEAP